MTSSSSVPSASSWRRDPRRTTLLIVGVLSTATGILGLVVPLLPTTCFLLIAAACFSKASPRALAALLDAPVLGSLLRARRDGTPIPVGATVWTLVSLWGGIGSSAVLLHRPPITVLLVTIAVIVSWHVITHAAWPMRRAIVTLES